MPTVILLAFGLFLIAVLGMAIGVILSGKRLRGSCGGVMGPDGTAIGDCLCARQGEQACDRAEPATEETAGALAEDTGGEAAAGEPQEAQDPPEPEPVRSSSTSSRAR